jgi:hypothetical protein
LIPILRIHPPQTMCPHNHTSRMRCTREKLTRYIGVGQGDPFTFWSNDKRIGSFSSSGRTASPPRLIPIVLTYGQNKGNATYLVRSIWVLAAARGTGHEWLLADGVQSLGQLNSERETMNDDQGRLLIPNAILSTTVL